MALAEDNALVVTAQAADWLLETTSNRGDQIAVAQFLCTLDGAACASVFEDSGILRRLMDLTRDALDVWYSRPNVRNQEVAELFGLALCHTFIHSPKDLAKRYDVMDLQLDQASSFGGKFLKALELVRNKYSPLSPEDEEYMLHVCFLSAIIGSRQIIQEYEWARLSRLNVKAHRMSDTLLCLWAGVVFHIARKRSDLLDYHWLYGLDKLVKVGEDEQDLVYHLAWAVLWSPEALISTQTNSKLELNAAEIYTTCLQRSQGLVHQCTDSDLDSLTRGTIYLISEYLNSLTVSGPGDAPLIRLASEAVLTLRKLLQNGSSASQVSQPGQLLNGVWMDAIADLMLNDRYHPLSDSVKCCIVRILLWVWQSRSDAGIDDEGLEAIFISSCRLWAPLEKQVASSIAGTFGADDKPLTTDDLTRIVEFIDYVQKQENRKTFDFIARNADVGINRFQRKKRSSDETVENENMEELKPYQTTRERFNDDPAVLMDLPPLEKISEFWKRYDHLADIHDKKMTSNLNGNLDVLLIFTNALLRLIVMKADNNTLSPTDLSPPFSPSSNSVIVNCLLYASLSCSLLAAVGAMMAKEWLQSFDRTGQTGPLEEQGRSRQNKFNGV
ncbi:hypothetical protein FRC05_008356 [Tulasnella sp. 425]|nr:hypothetical protein FRC05_008356 [Tulasnella sp. 425]